MQCSIGSIVEGAKTIQPTNVYVRNIFKKNLYFEPTHEQKKP